MGIAEDIIQVTNELLKERSQMTHHCTTCNRQALHDALSHAMNAHKGPDA